MYDSTMFFLFSYFVTVYSNLLVPGEVASIYQGKRIGKIARELQNEKLHFYMTFSLASPLSLLKLP